MRFDHNSGREKNYEPNSFGGPVESGRPLYAPIAVEGLAASHERVRHSDDDDFVQAGALYRLMPPDAQERLVDNIAGSLSRVSRDVIVERAIANFRAADPDYGARVEARVKELRAQ
jgi:catalase